MQKKSVDSETHPVKIVQCVQRPKCAFTLMVISGTSLVWQMPNCQWLREDGKFQYKVMHTNGLLVFEMSPQFKFTPFLSYFQEKINAGCNRAVSNLTVETFECMRKGDAYCAEHPLATVVYESL